MGILDIILIGVALAMDAFSLTLANCVSYKKSLNKAKEFSMPVAFALFQFVMPVIGYYVGSIFAEYLTSVADYLVAGVFLVLAVKVLIDTIKEFKQTSNDKSNGKFTFILLLIQGIATSIDALLIGVSFATSTASGDLTYNIFLCSAIIGAVTFGIVLVALFIGKMLGKILSKWAGFLGATILFALFIKTLVCAFI